eukprot:jgi/Botrbrau1/19619/Bobra.0879s0001.1
MPPSHSVHMVHMTWLPSRRMRPSHSVHVVHEKEHACMHVPPPHTSMHDVYHNVHTRIYA